MCAGVNPGNYTLSIRGMLDVIGYASFRLQVKCVLAKRVKGR